MTYSFKTKTAPARCPFGTIRVIVRFLDFLAPFPVRYYDAHEIHTRASADSSKSYGVLTGIDITPIDYIANIDRCPPDLGLVRVELTLQI